MALLDILQQYSDPARARTDRIDDDFDEVVRQAPPRELGSGVAEAFRSDATPPFGQMIGNLFGQSDPQQRAGILNQLVWARRRSRSPSAGCTPGDADDRRPPRPLVTRCG
jgi:hypothetical protein